LKTTVVELFVFLIALRVMIIIITGWVSS